ncbi:hypothetical protein ACF1A9_28725 [Streptomyces sp. NPDC014872]|uniref:hypothetical protein n=1 Tax=Streptomyces sp. NPDC014872 TaxID=3364926 RepID=UPI003700BC6D
MTSAPLSAAALTHLRKASVHRDGHLPASVGKKMLALFVENKYVYRDDADGYVLEGNDALQDVKAPDLEARPFFITTAGRHAALNDGQIRALTEGVGPDGRLARTVAWPTAHALARLLLVELRDEQGNPAPGDGIPFRTELGKTVAEETPTLGIA